MFNDQRFNDTLTNYIVSFEQLGPEKLDLLPTLAGYHVVFVSFLPY